MESPKSKILVVDDEPNVLLTVEAILASEGYDVDAIADSEAALQAIRAHQYDLVLTDLKMPKVDGLGILAEVRKSSPNTVCVMMTGYASVDTALEAVQLGAYEYLLKPTEVAELRLAVSRSLERKRLSEIDTLYRISHAVNATSDVYRLANEVSEAARQVLNVLSATVAWPPEISSALCDPELAALLSDSEVRRRLGEGSILLPGSGIGAVEEWARRHDLRGYALVPGVSRGRLVCVLCAHNNGNAYEFHASAQRFLQSLAGQTALALNNASLIAELRHNNQQLEAANAKLRELDRLKSQFLSTATHELRTPLTIILGYNSMLGEALADRLAPDEQDALREAVASCKRLIRLVNSMLDISQIESGRTPMSREPTDVRLLVNSTVALFQNEARQRNLALTLHVPARLPKILLDGERIQQVLVNLVGNAFKFTADGGEIRIGVRHRADAQQMEISVSDTGIGMTAKQQSQLFEEFAPIQRSRPEDGAGLGLAISRRIVQAHEGSIQVTSEPGRGSTFQVILPTRQRATSLRTAVSA
jgi:signal transduction histidine kinase/DNA-binding response OmpR family regulator